MLDPFLVFLVRGERVEGGLFSFSSLPVRVILSSYFDQFDSLFYVKFREKYYIKCIN